MLAEPPHAFVDSVANRVARAADRTLLADIDTKIADLEHALAQLRTAKDSAQARLDAFKYPVLTLPVEIVSEIFTNFLPAYPLCPPLIGLFSPTLMTHICRLWREIALNTPTLWRAITLSTYYTIPTRTLVHIGHLWLERSRNCPLSMEIEGRGDVPDISPVIEAVAPHRARWEHLRLAVPELQTDLPLLGPMPLLRSLTVRELYLPNTAGSQLDAPLLRSANIDDATAQHILLPWAQLTSLTLHNVFASECTPILQQTPYLVHCSLHLWLPRVITDVPPQMSLPHLESLVITEEDADPVTGYLETFLVPGLSTLRIQEPCLGVDPIGGLRSFIGKSDCKLRDVVITHKKSGSTSIDSYRNAFPSILNFSFEY
ncbi:hypothetical protein C8R46DRAFT_549537 [Mycena filopes]|nr:hypothetical protein C8R46DRAFT_549537 [Mycena filopes]